MNNRKKAEAYFYDEYEEICKKLYLGYKTGLTKRLSKDGHSHLLLIKNGTVEKILCDYIKNLFEDYIENILKIMDTIKEEFDIYYSLKFINEFEIKNEHNISSHMNSIEKELENILKNELSETTKSSLINIKQNAINNTMISLKKKNESIKRLIKKNKKQNSFLFKIIKVIVDKFIERICIFLLVVCIGNYDRIIDFIRNIIRQ